MRRYLSLILSVYLLAGSFFPGNGFAYFSELPLLLQHYRYHYYVETPGVGFYDFIALHYYDDVHEQSDPVHHKKLPLHHRMNTPPADRIVFAPDTGDESAVAARVTHTLPVVDDPFVTSMLTRGVFHPPKG